MGRRRLDKGQIEVVDDVVAEILRHKTPAERVQISFDMWTSVRNMLTVHLQKPHPEWGPKRVTKEVARRLFSGSLEEFEKALKSFDSWSTHLDRTLDTATAQAALYNNSS